MKFTKDELLESLKAKLSNNGKKNLAMTDRTFNPLFETLYKRTEKENDENLELDDAVTEYLPVFEAVNGNIQKDNSDFIKEWGQKHPGNEPKRESIEQKDKVEPDARFDKLFKEFETMKKEREAERAAKTLSDYKSDVSRLLGDKLKDFDNAKGWIQRRLKGYAFDVSADKDELVKSLVEDYNADFAGVKPSSNPKSTGLAPENMEHEFDDIKSLLNG